MIIGNHIILFSFLFTVILFVAYLPTCQSLCKTLFHLKYRLVGSELAIFLVARETRGAFHRSCILGNLWKMWQLLAVNPNVCKFITGNSCSSNFAPKISEIFCRMVCERFQKFNNSLNFWKLLLEIYIPFVHLSKNSTDFSKFLVEWKVPMLFHVWIGIVNNNYSPKWRWIVVDICRAARLISTTIHLHFGE